MEDNGACYIARDHSGRALRRAARLIRSSSRALQKGQNRVE
jgi:hypothetical protein